MEIPRIHRVWWEGFCEVAFSKAATMYTKSNSVWPFVCIHSPLLNWYTRDPDGESTAKGSNFFIAKQWAGMPVTSIS